MGESRIIDGIELTSLIESRLLGGAGIAKRQTASKYLKALESAGILKGKKVGREVYYVNERLIRVLAE